MLFKSVYLAHDQMPVATDQGFSPVWTLSNLEKNIKY